MQKIAMMHLNTGNSPPEADITIIG